LRSLALLEALQAALQTRGCDAQASESARDVTRYFDIAGPAHHTDEERHVLPLLRSSGNRELAKRLAEEHRLFTTQWPGIRSLLVAVRLGSWPRTHNEVAAHTWPAFIGLYREHIHMEEAVAFPAVRGMLEAADLQAMAMEMARRRNP
jgi:hemerythrin-like domain-containing protein